VTGNVLYHDAMDTHTDRTTQGRAVRLALGGMLAMAAGIGIGRFVYTPILPPMTEALGFTKSTAGLIASANFVGYLAGALLAAFSTLPGSRRAWLLGALTISAATTAAMGLTMSVPIFLALRFAGGVSSALVLILSSSLVLERLAAQGRGTLTPLHFAGVGVGIVASAVAVAALQALALPWQTLWFGAGALALAATLGVWGLVPDSAGTAPSPAKAGAADGALGWLVAAYGLFGFGYVITATFIVAIVRSTPSIAPLEPAIWVVVGLAAAPSVILWTWLARRFGIVGGFGLACLTEAVGVLASVVWPTASGIMLASALLGGTFMGLTALGLMRARELAAGLDPRRAMARLTGMFGLGQIVGPIFAGAVFDMTGDFALPSYVAAAGLVVAALLVRVRR